MAQTTYTLTQHTIKTGKAIVVNQGRVPHTRKWIIDHFENSKLYNLSECGKFKFMGRSACKSVYMTTVSKRGQYYSLTINERTNEKAK